MKLYVDNLYESYCFVKSEGSLPKSSLQVFVVSNYQIALIKRKFEHFKKPRIDEQEPVFHFSVCLKNQRS